MSSLHLWIINFFNFFIYQDMVTERNKCVKSQQDTRSVVVMFVYNVFIIYF